MPRELDQLPDNNRREGAGSKAGKTSETQVGRRPVAGAGDEQDLGVAPSLFRDSGIPANEDCCLRTGR
ncbi:hypothetical protein V5E97_35475 [Singulisphaera sp. Ch08]|uniref:Uncharacterized protein n=1 Tax=Singulisphaera sp. Ch08 TaxID=3120278 RepID=A0AAU7CE86_9BACT